MVITEYAKTFLCLNYLWGGSSPLEGFDCSGFVLECMKSIGLIAHGEDMTSQGLYSHFLNNGMKSGVGEGALCFYGAGALKITHVALMLNEWQIIEAGGGDSTVTNFEMAKRKGAWIRIRPYNYRKDLVAVIQPNYPKWVFNGPRHSV